MFIGLASDVHGRWDLLTSWAKDRNLDTVVVCGDLDAGPIFPLPVYFCYGNNDDRTEFDHWRRTGLMENCFPIDDYGIVEIGGLKWMFIGCKLNRRVGAGIVASPPENLTKVDAIVTHEAPIRTGTIPPHPVIEDVVRRVQPQWCFSGHRHEAAHDYLGSTECISLGTSPESWAVLHAESKSLTLPPIFAGGSR